MLRKTMALLGILVPLAMLAPGCDDGGASITVPECETDAECASGVCDAGGSCAEPACDDGIMNGDELAVDCGGSCTACACADIANCTAVSCTTPADETCTECAPDFEADGSGGCQIIVVVDACESDPCGNGNTCSDDGDGTYTCTCTVGSYDDGTTCTVCEAITNCDAVTCNTDSDETCATCASGFEVAGDGTCDDINDCTGDPCGAGNTCADTGAGTYSCACADGNFDDGTTCSGCDAVANCDAVTCTSADDEACGTCATGFEADGADGCQDINDCVGDPCGAGNTCTDTGVGSFDCGCAAGSFDDGATCTACDAVANCAAVTCTSVDDEACGTCAAGYESDGAGGCQDADSCVGDPCGAGNTCADTGPSTYTCGCVLGSYDDGATCATCDSVTHCDVVTCINANSEVCAICSDGYQSDGAGGCRDSDDCGSGPCGVGNTCMDTGVNSYSCGCSGGEYDDGTTCASCEPIANCGTVSCTTADDESCLTCDGGYQSDGAGGCEDINDCAASPCGSGTCMDTGVSSYSCTCSDGHYDTGTTCSACDATCSTCDDAGSTNCTGCPGGFDLVGGACTPSANPCAGDPCGVGGSCQDMSGVAVCACPDGAFGDGSATCNPCTVLGGCGQLTCTDASDSMCGMCNAGFYDDGAGGCSACTPIGNCDAVGCLDDMDETCSMCATNYEDDGAGGCRNIDDCTGAPCGMSGACNDGLGTYSCTCDDGFYDDATTCAMCDAVTNCPDVSCSVAGDSVCDMCSIGFYDDGAGGCAESTACEASNVAGTLIISGVMDATLSGGKPKVIELYVLSDIADLSIYGVGSANNGGGTDGEEFTFPIQAAAAGTYIYITTDAAAFMMYFGFAPDFTEGNASNINGDDAVELFENGSVIDVYGQIDVDGDNTFWEYANSWAYRNDRAGADGTFTEANWTFAGPGAVAGCLTTNAACGSVYPIGSYSGASAPCHNGVCTETGLTTFDCDCSATGTVGDTCSEPAPASGLFSSGANQNGSYSSDGAATWGDVQFSAIDNGRASAWGGGRLVVVGDGTAGYSLDAGQTWTAATTPTPAGIFGVTHGAGRFVAVGSSGMNAYSEDGGDNWTAVAHTTGALRDVAFGDGVFLAVGLAGVAARSADGGLTWTSVDHGFGQMVDIEFNNGRFVAVGAFAGTGETGFYTDDAGDTWVGVTTATGNTTGLAYGGGRFVTTRTDSALYSADQGLTWVFATTPPLSLMAVAYDGAQFVGVGNNEAYTSPDGDVWTIAGDTANGQMLSITYAPFGDTCELQGQPCLNASVCINGDQGFACDCAGTGFTGDLCNVDL
ncbi:MAG: hypothetical protein ACI9MR_001380 [Myxococcota bacterium]|jgi:hypothetical protein